MLHATFPIASSCFFRALALTPSQTMLKLAAAVLLCVAALGSAFTTPLDEYIALPDPTYSFYETVTLLCVCPITTCSFS